MKIALVCPYDLAYHGGVQNHVMALYYNLSQLGHEVYILASSSKAINTLSHNIILLGRPWPFYINGSIGRIPVSPWLPQLVKQVLIHEKFDIIHLHEPLCPLLCTSVLNASQSLNIATFHAFETPSYSLGRLLFRRTSSALFNKLHGRIAVSKPAMEFVSRYFPSDYSIIPNGVDLDRFNPVTNPRPEYVDGKLNLLFVGRLEKRKGINYLLEAYRCLKQEITQSRLILVGSSTRWSRKYEHMTRHNKQYDIVFTGPVSDSDLPGYFASADICCFPAIGRESFGMVLLEAMAMGKPIVATSIDGYTNVVTQNSEGLLTPPTDSAAFADSLLRLAADERLRKEMGYKGRIKAARYGWERITKEVIDYYQVVLGGSTKRYKAT